MKVCVNDGFSNVIGICVGSCIALLSIYCRVQTRAHITPRAASILGWNQTCQHLAYFKVPAIVDGDIVDLRHDHDYRYCVCGTTLGAYPDAHTCAKILEYQYIADFYSMIHANVAVRIHGVEGEEMSAEFPGRKLQKALSGVYAKELALISGQHSGFANWGKYDDVMK